MTDNFAQDPKVQPIAEAYALQAVDFAKNNFDTDLDWTDHSVARVEELLATLHDQIAVAKPSAQEIFDMAKLFGSYVGEVFRRNHGATWGLVTLDGQSFPGLRADGAAGLFWPWGRANKRLIEGPSDNIWHYYELLLERNGSAGAAQGDSSSARKSCWSRLSGR